MGSGYLGYPKVRSLPVGGHQPPAGQGAQGPGPAPAPPQAPPAGAPAPGPAPQKPGLLARAWQGVASTVAQASRNAVRHDAAQAIGDWIANTRVTPERLLQELESGSFSVGLLVPALRQKLGAEADAKLVELREKYGPAIAAMDPDDYLAILRDDALSGRFPYHARMLFDHPQLYIREMETAKRLLLGG